MNRLTELFNRRTDHILSIYFTAGFPKLNDTRSILQALQDAGVDLVEIGMPYSDPVADGETIQQANQQALENGMTLKVLFEQLRGFRERVQIPVLLMGYINPVLQFGLESFCEQCQEMGIDGLILPDLPLEVYEREYKTVMERYGLKNVFLITPQTNESRIRQIDGLTESFIYMVSSAGVTGAKQTISQLQEGYFERIAALNLKNPKLIGFGISNHETFKRACRYAQGAIIGSAFVKLLQQATDISQELERFIDEIRQDITVDESEK
jgi:tryptophan synthase alpha chain